MELRIDTKFYNKNDNNTYIVKDIILSKLYGSLVICKNTITGEIVEFGGGIILERDFEFKIVN